MNHLLSTFRQLIDTFLGHSVKRYMRVDFFFAFIETEINRQLSFAFLFIHIFRAMENENENSIQLMQYNVKKC